MNNQLSDAKPQSKIDCLQKIVEALEIENLDGCDDEFKGKSHKI